MSGYSGWHLHPELTEPKLAHWLEDERVLGFRWARNEIRVHVVLHEVDDAAPNNLMCGDSEEAMNENFRELYPGPMANLPPLRFIEPLNPNNEKFKYPSEPHAYVADVVVQSEDVIDVTEVMNKGIRAAQWDAMADLRDIIAKGEKIGWFVVHNGDRHLAQQERLKKDENGANGAEDEADAVAEAEAIESKYSKGLSEQVGRLQVHNRSDGRSDMSEKADKKGGKFKKLFRGDSSLPLLPVENARKACVTGAELNTFRYRKTNDFHRFHRDRFMIHGLPRKIPEAAQDRLTAAQDSNGNLVPSYSPARPPAVPLAIRSPYTSAWSSTSSNGTLNTNGVIFWPGTPLGWEGIVTVDGISYEYLGTGSTTLPKLPELQPAKPLTVTYDSQYSNFTFAAGPVVITASFLSSVLPEDLCRTSIPLSYFTTSIHSTDDRTHDVQFYSDVNAAWAASENNFTV
ncbi:MAG: hypothetical protein L6R38_008261 [Xanthoria sp. 2 TBL-2021]|nr:MAG: hypothetical protein L6R38_008261 [Xanthoria sp. 2 TBL-2021]